MRWMWIMVLSFWSISYLNAQAPKNNNAMNDPDAAALLKKTSDKYKAQKSVCGDFTLLVIKPKLKPEESDAKYTETINGTLAFSGAKFKILFKDQQLICDGKTIWTYIVGDKEVQVNYYEENEESFTPSRIFTMYKEGFIYQTKEKKSVNGKTLTVVEMSPVNRKVSYFKIDVTIDEATSTIVESKVYEKSGVRYVYKLTKQTPNCSVSDDFFTFDAKKYPEVNVVDLR